MHVGVELMAAVVILVGGTVIDGTGRPPVEDALVAVQDGRIAWVGPAAYAPEFPDAEVIECDGATILPGIINAHVHEVADADLRRAFAAAGVTTLGLTGAPWTDIDRVMEPTGQEGWADTARVAWCGPMLTAPGGFPGVRLDPALDLPVSTAAQARQAVREVAERGAAFVKIVLEPGPWMRQRAGHPYPTLSPEIASAAVEEAHRLGLLVRAHITDAAMAAVALDAGVDVIDHVPRPLVTHAEAREILAAPDPVEYLFATHSPEYTVLIDRMASAGVVLVPTLTSAGVAADRSGATDLERVGLQVLLGAVSRFHEAGGVIALGNDYPEAGAEVGVPVVEMQLLERAGLTPMEIIVATTRNAARACGLGSDLGTLEAGRIADLIIVHGNPLDDIRVLADPAMVMQGSR